MLELTITPEELAKAKQDIKNWCNPDGSLNVKKMQWDIKRELIEKRTKSMRRKTHKITTTNSNHKKNIIPPPVETPRLNPTIERIKQVQL